MASVGKKDLVLADLKAVAAKFGLHKAGAKQILIDKISNAIAGGEETQYKYYSTGHRS